MVLRRGENKENGTEKVKNKENVRETAKKRGKCLSIGKCEIQYAKENIKRK